MKTRASALALGLSLLAGGTASAAYTDNVVRIGVLNDQSGLYVDIMGHGSIIAARMAVEDFGGKIGDTPIEVVAADNQNKADVGAAIAGKWYDAEGVDMIAEIANSSVALAVVEIAKQKNKVAIVSGSNTNRLTGDSCTPNHVHWAFDNYALANATAKAVVKQGGTSWFFITSDYAFGHDMEKQAGDIVKQAGGTVIGSVRAPLNSSDFASYLLQAQGSGAKVIGLANATADFTNTVKQGKEFGILAGGQQFAGLTVYLTDIDGLGLEAAQGTLLSVPFYWDLNDRTRKFANRFFERHGKMPTAYQASVYSQVTHYLKAVKALGSDADGRAVVAKMKELPTDDDAYGQGSVRVDGRKLHPMYLFQVKTPQESKRRWDYYKLVSTIPVEEAWKPLDPACSLVPKQ
ncbi:ABC transporter substrate-binding protein [Azospirillum doebereinerae]|uniref:ABC transporter substrate-binding protein n=1 Tax=Azospirillum doebereinerae TaxID=92933 RepID=A0A433J3M9_9PROT|nr:ABC transporter substrate-binding protein [Azospirillum doebereinerae]MCG5241296.1 ABC transporter substrate-binding protein [Azospirillum doebereinerae]RUQ66386.1 ABC transporter substrate-binding protein [Azospirillum doebereinerae]